MKSKSGDMFLVAGFVLETDIKRCGLNKKGPVGGAR